MKYKPINALLSDVTVEDSDPSTQEYIDKSDSETEPTAEIQPIPPQENIVKHQHPPQVAAHLPLLHARPNRTVFQNPSNLGCVLVVKISCSWSCYLNTCFRSGRIVETNIKNHLLHLL